VTRDSANCDSAIIRQSPLVSLSPPPALSLFLRTSLRIFCPYALSGHCGGFSLTLTLYLYVLAVCAFRIQFRSLYFSLSLCMRGRNLLSGYYSGPFLVLSLSLSLSRCMRWLYTLPRCYPISLSLCTSLSVSLLFSLTFSRFLILSLFFSDSHSISLPLSLTEVFRTQPNQHVCCVLQCDLQCELKCRVQYVLQCVLQCALQCAFSGSVCQGKCQSIRYVRVVQIVLQCVLQFTLQHVLQCVLL